MSATIGLLISAALAAGTAIPVAASAPGAPLPSAAVSAAPARGAPPKTVDGLTVVAPLPAKPCARRDKACIALVVAELKRLYPDQLKRFCFQRTMRAMRTQMVNDQLLEGLGGDDPPTPNAFGVNAALATACASDRK